MSYPLNCPVFCWQGAMAKALERQLEHGESLLVEGNALRERAAGRLAGGSLQPCIDYRHPRNLSPG